MGYTPYSLNCTHTANRRTVRCNCNSIRGHKMTYTTLERCHTVDHDTERCTKMLFSWQLCYPRQSSSRAQLSDMLPGFLVRSTPPPNLSVCNMCQDVRHMKAPKNRNTRQMDATETHRFVDLDSCIADNVCTPYRRLAIQFHRSFPSGRYLRAHLPSYF